MTHRHRTQTAIDRARDGQTATGSQALEEVSHARMKSVKVIDVTLRDGQQSLWATRMTNGMFMPCLQRMDEMGFDWIDLVGGAVFDVCVRYLREDPWRRMRLAAERVTETPLNVWTRGQSLFTFEFFPDDIVELTIRRCAANGIARYTCYDALNDIRNIELSMRVARESGMFASGHLVYTVSPVHTDEYYGGVAREIAALGVDSVGIKDPSGLLTPERARTLVPAVRRAIGDLPLEMHTHCRSGLGELVCLEGVPLGVDIVHTGIRPLACGDALPDGRYVVRRLKEAGYDIRLDDRDLEEMEEYFTGIALQYDKPLGKPLRYDPFLYHHQVPGGMISNLRSQLRDLDMEDSPRCGAGGGGPGPRRSRLPDSGQSLCAVRHHPGGHQRRAERALRNHPGRGRALRVRPLRHAARPDFAWCARPRRFDGEMPRAGDRASGGAGPATGCKAGEGTRSLRVRR